MYNVTKHGCSNEWKILLSLVLLSGLEIMVSMELAECATDGTRFLSRIPTLLKAARNHFFPMNLPSHQPSGRSTNEAFPCSTSAMGKTWTVVTSLFLLVKTFIRMEQVVISLQTCNWQVGTAPPLYQSRGRFSFGTILATSSCSVFKLQEKTPQFIP